MSFLTHLPAKAQSTQLPNKLNKVGIDQNLKAQIPLDLEFTEETGNSIKLSKYFNNTPVILALSYYKCPMLCSLILNNLTKSLNDSSLVAGKDYILINASFDPSDTTKLAAAKKEQYLNSYKQDDAQNSWHFLTGTTASIATLTKAVGFHYEYDEDSQQYAHASGIMILTPKGEIAQYFLGIDYAPKKLEAAIKDARQNRIGNLVKQFLLFCFHYDPTQSRYGATIINAIRLGGMLTVLSIGFFIFGLRKRGKNVF